MDLIEISSSDSEFEIEDSREIDTSPINGPAHSRILPQWASTPETNSTGTGSKGNYAANGSSSNLNHHYQGKPSMHLSSSGGIRASGQYVARGDDSKHLKEFQQRTLNSQTINASGKSFEKLSSQESLKRTLPLSLQPAAASAKSSNSVEKVGSSQNWDTRGKSYQLAGPRSTNGSGYGRDHYNRGIDDEIIMYENNGSRILPVSLMKGKSTSTTHFASSSESLYHSGPSVVTEEIAGIDERLIYQAALQDLTQPKVEATMPDGLLTIRLLRHQKIALAWMLQKETNCLHCLGGILADDQGLGKTISMIALIQMQRSLQSKYKSEDRSNHKTEALNLDDEDDNGTADLDRTKQTTDCDDSKPTLEVSASIREFSRRRPAAGTLVVCPASVLRQWARELDEKVSDEAKLSVLIYHGGSRTKDPVELAKYDVVLTTYSIVTIEVPKQPLGDEDDLDEKNGEKCGVSSGFMSKKRKKAYNVSKKGKKGRKGTDSSCLDYDCGALARVGWFRVILDEAQTIKNHRTQVARACCTLRAKSRWCLSGTPIQNTVEDLYSYFRFLKYGPLTKYKTFLNAIKVPISRNLPHGYKKLQAVLRTIMLRRTKGTLIDGEPIINLPPKSITLSKVEFSTEERAFYTKLEADSRSQFKAYAAAGTVNQNYANILLLLLRLRQACDHPLLVKGYNSDSARKVSVKMAKKLPTDMLVNLWDLLETSLAICLVCNDTPEDPVVTMCGHIFCYQCISEYLTGDDNSCPAPECKEQLGVDAVFSKATLISCLSDDLDGSSMNSHSEEKAVVLQSEYNSSKIRAVLEILQSHSKSNSPNPDLPEEAPVKTIIFSQWTRMLDLVEYSLNQSCIQYRRLDGTMSLVARDRAVKDFNTDTEILVMLMSLKAGNLGLNMVAASHVILLDLWWNPTTEDQAVDRAHRIGQTRPVTVTRMTIKDTVEDRILALQEEKRKMVSSAFGEDQGGGSGTRLTVEDLRYLFRL